MANIYKRFKRKKRTSDSDLETISPEEEEEKSLWDEASHLDDTMITDSPGEGDKIIEALDMTQSVASQLQLILSFFSFSFLSFFFLLIFKIILFNILCCPNNLYDLPYIVRKPIVHKPPASI